MNISSLVLSVLNIISNNQANVFNDFCNSLIDHDIECISDYGIDSYEKLINKITNEKNNEINIKKPNEIKYCDIYNNLNLTYPDFNWVLTEGYNVKNATGNIPLNVQGSLFPYSDIIEAVNESSIESAYGGCGPIALIGIIDYYSRYLNYSEFIAKPEKSSDRIKLGINIFKNTKTYEIYLFNELKGTWAFSKDLVNSFNEFAKIQKVNDKLYSYEKFSIFPSFDQNRINLINSIKKGNPVTLVTTFLSGENGFGAHSTNIYGYEIWKGINLNTGEEINKEFIIGRLNWQGYDDEYCCDSSILNDWLIGMVFYDEVVSKYDNFYSSDFSKFINASNQGQYFYYEKEKDIISFQNKSLIKTKRLRCSYIENEFLVLSPNRKGAGDSYLELIFSKDISNISFESSLWGELEDVKNETFYIEVYDNEDDRWIKYIEFDLEKISKNKKIMSKNYILLPRDVYSFRFRSKKINPLQERNKGRICLDNIFIQSYEEF